MRKQYHFRPSSRGLRAWDVDKLAQLTAGLESETVPLTEIGELDEPYWFGDGVPPSVRAVAEHARLIEEADLSFPVILCPEGRVMDGMHRIAKAALRGDAAIAAYRLRELPEPDFVGIEPDDLPY